MVGGMGMFFSYPQDFKEKQVAPGVVLRIIWGEKIMLSYVTFQRNSNVPTHNHPTEQTGIVLEGEIRFTIDNNTCLCNKGDAYTIPDNIEHSAATGDKPAIVLEAFSPPREDYK